MLELSNYRFIKIKVKDEFISWYTNTWCEGRILCYDEEHLLIQSPYGSPDRYINGTYDVLFVSKLKQPDPFPEEIKSVNKVGFI